MSFHRSPSLDGLLAQIQAWQAVTFTRATPDSVAEHIRREADELKANPYAGDEIADLFILICAAAALADVDLASVVQEKFDVCLSRTWKQPDAMGVVEHVR